MSISEISSPASASCQAASLPAMPPPTTVTRVMTRSYSTPGPVSRVGARGPPLLRLEACDGLLDPLLLHRILHHRQGLAVGGQRRGAVALDRERLAEAVLGVPRLGVLLDHRLEHRDRLVDLLLAEQLVTDPVEV